MTNEKAPERIWLSPASFAYKTSPAPTYIYSETEREPQDIEYIRADLLATKAKEEREAAFKDAVAVVEKLTCPAQFDGNWRNGYSHAQNDAFRAIEAFATENRKGEG